MRYGTPPTLEQYRRMELERPLTDKGIGATTHVRRAQDAAASSVFEEHDSPARPGAKPNNSLDAEEAQVACGTTRGYRLHRTKQEPTCDLCKKAETKRRRAKYIRTTKEAG